MSKWQEEFVKYVDCYVRLLTEHGGCVQNRSAVGRRSEAD